MANTQSDLVYRALGYLGRLAAGQTPPAEDFDQVIDGGNFVTKVIYLPDPKYQELAVSGVETLVSTRLEPGVDPILEADRRGTILMIVRLGAIDLEMPTGAAAVAPPGGAMGGAMPGAAVAPARERDVALCLRERARLPVHDGRLRQNGGARRRRRGPLIESPPPHAPPCLRLRPCQQGSRHPRYPGLARP